MASGKKYQVDMTHGPLLGKIIRFAIPLMMANAMSLMFNAADLIVVGRFASSEAMAAVGAAPGFNNLLGYCIGSECACRTLHRSQRPQGRLPDGAQFHRSCHYRRNRHDAPRIDNDPSDDALDGGSGKDF